MVSSEVTEKARATASLQIYDLPVSVDLSAILLTFHVTLLGNS
jgi:uncharacterized protein YceK